jgi:hypothetical protein
VSVKIRVIGDLRRFLDSETVEIGGGLSLGAVVDEQRAVRPRDRDELIEDGGELLLTPVSQWRLPWMVIPPVGSPFMDGKSFVVGERGYKRAGHV